MRIYAKLLKFDWLRNLTDCLTINFIYIVQEYLPRVDATSDT